MAKDGQKMSKSKKNYPDPNLLFDKYGADAVRLYLISSVAVSGGDLRFKGNIFILSRVGDLPKVVDSPKNIRFLKFDGLPKIDNLPKFIF